jgi:hypothetical protein
MFTILLNYTACLFVCCVDGHKSYYFPVLKLGIRRKNAKYLVLTVSSSLRCVRPGTRCDPGLVTPYSELKAVVF